MLFPECTVLIQLYFNVIYIYTVPRFRVLYISNIWDISSLDLHENLFISVIKSPYKFSKLSDQWETSSFCDSWNTFFYPNPYQPKSLKESIDKKSFFDLAWNEFFLSPTIEWNGLARIIRRLPEKIDQYKELLL